MVRAMDQKALDRIVSTVHIQRLIEPEEIARTIGMVVENDAIDATTVEVTGGMISGMIAK
jgi:3-oxoacyl-[acyl-carrier protein] reductase